MGWLPELADVPLVVDVALVVDVVVDDVGFDGWDVELLAPVVESLPPSES